MKQPALITSFLVTLLTGTASFTEVHAADAVVEPNPILIPYEAPKRSVLIGGGAGFQPLYEGSDEYRAFPFPIISYDSGETGPRRFEFRALDDIRFHALRFSGISVGPIAGYRFGREESDSTRLTGLGDIDGGIVLGGFASYEFFQDDHMTWSADVGISTQVTGDPFDERRFDNIALPANVRAQLGDGYEYGYEIDFGFSGEIAVDERLNIGMRVGATYASEEYLQTNFGVSAAQAFAANSLGNPINTFDADAGIKNIYLNVNATYELTDKIQLRAGLGYSRLIGDAAKSPITEDKNQFSGNLGIAYRFKFCLVDGT